MIRGALKILLLVVLLLSSQLSLAISPVECGRLFNAVSLNLSAPKRDAIPKNTRLIVAANRLPYSVNNKNQQWSSSVSAGGLVSALKSTGKSFDWIGWPGGIFKKSDGKKVKKALDAADDNLTLSPILLTEKEKKDYYDEFSNRQLWPIFHDMTDNMPSEVVGWETYQAVNKKFAESILEQVRSVLAESDGKVKPLVWVQDYQLMLVPQYLRKMLEREGLADKVKIGFFLHIPFPKTESLEKLPPKIREEILEGLAASDEVAFHSTAYSKNFLDTMEKLAPRFVKNGKLSSAGRDIAVKEHPIGINPETYRSALEAPKAQAIVKDLREKYKGYKVLLGVERLDPIKGIPEKLLAFERFLEKNPEYIGKTVLVQVAQPSRTDLPEYIKLRDGINKIAERINKRFSVAGKLAPVQLDQNGFGIDQLVAHYSIADTTMITSLKDGMNLVAFEATAVQKGSSNPGTLILSQETGAAEWLNGAIKVDPKNIDQVADSIKFSLGLTVEQKMARTAENLKYVDTNTSNNWVADSLDSINKKDGK